MSEDTSQNFESTLKELEEVVGALEKGDLTLEQQLEAYERGVKLAGRCKTLLENASLRVQELNKNEAIFEDDDD